MQSSSKRARTIVRSVAGAPSAGSYCRNPPTGTAASHAGSDSTPSLMWNIYHILDTRVPVDPTTFDKRLEAAGFSEITIRVREQGVVTPTVDVLAHQVHELVGDVGAFRFERGERRPVAHQRAEGVTLDGPVALKLGEELLGDEPPRPFQAGVADLAAERGHVDRFGHVAVRLDVNCHGDRRSGRATHDAR